MIYGALTTPTIRIFKFDFTSMKESFRWETRGGNSKAKDFPTLMKRTRNYSVAYFAAFSKLLLQKWMEKWEICCAAWVVQIKINMHGNKTGKT